MTNNPKYQNAYNLGYNQGYKKGLLKAAEVSEDKTIANNDLKHIYGNLILALHKRGWKTDTIRALMVTVQEMWVEECKEVGECYNAGIPSEAIEDKVYRITGIPIDQICEDIMNIEV